MCHPWDSGDGSNPCYQFEDRTRTWHIGPDPISNVEEAAGVLMRNDEIWWLTGGRLGSGTTYTAATEILDATDSGPMTFESFDPLPDSACFHNVVAINDSAVFFLDGGLAGEYYDKAWIYDLNSRTWNPIEDMPLSKSFAVAGYAESSDGLRKFVVVTGGDGNDRTTWMFDLYGEFWKPGNDFPFQAYLSTSVPFTGKTFLVVGGSGSDNIVEFEPDTETWVIRPEKLKSSKQEVAAFMVPDDYATC